MAKARKQLNYRILLLMGTVVVVLLGVFLAATQLTSSLTPEEYIAKCDKALKKDPVDWSGAMGNLNSAIRATGDETFPGKLFLRGYQILSDQVKQDRSLSLADRQQRQGAAMRMLDRALERNAKYCPALIKKMEFYYPRFASNPKGYQPRIRDFITNMTTVLNSPEYQHNAKFYFQRGMANWYLRRLAGTGRGKEYAEAAIVDFNQAVIKASGDEATPEDKENEIPYRLELAKRYSDLGEEEKANAEYDKGIKANPTSASLYVGYSSYLRKQKKEAESLEQIKLAIEKGDNPALGYVELAVHHSIKQEYSQAEEALNNALKKDSAALVVYPSMARLQWIQNRPDAAFAWLRKGLVALREHVEKKDPNKKKVNARRWRRMLNYRLADYLLDVAIYARGDDQAKVPDLLAEAQECHTNLVQIYEKDPLQLIIAGKIAYVKKDWPEARRCLEEATKGGQRDLNTITTLSMVYQNLRLPSKAEKLVNAILAINVEIPNRVRFLLTAANFRIKAHDYLKALRLVNLALEADADNSDVHRFRRILAQALASDTTLIVPKSDDERNMVLLRAREMVLEERYEGAEKRLLMLREHDPKDTDSARLLLELYQRTNRKPKAQELLATLIEEDPTNESFQRMSEWLMADPERRVALQKEYAHALEDVPLRYLRLSDICTRANEAEKAKEWFNKAVKEYPEDQRVVKARIAKLLKDKEWASVAKLLDQIDNETDRKLATANLAKHQEKWGEAISIYKQVLEESPHWKAVRFLLGQCYFDSKDIPEAKKQYNWIVNEDNTHLAAMKELARIAQQEGQYDEFMTILREIRRYPHGRQDTEIDRWWTRRELDTKDRPAAITRREVIFRKAPNDASNILSLARLYEQEKDVPRAQAKYEYLYKTTENPMQYAQTLSLFYYRTGMHNKAHDLFKSLLQKANSDAAKADAYLVYGQFLSLSDPGAAQVMYDNARKLMPKNVKVLGSYSNFLEFQARKASGRGEGPKARQLWAASVALLQEAIRGSEQVEGLRKVLYRRMMDAGMLDKAKQGYETLLRENPKNVEARYGLSMVYYSMGDMDAAVAQCDAAVKTDPNYGRIYLLRGSICRARSDMDGAVKEVAKAVTIQPLNLVFRLELAKLYIEMEKYSKASEELLVARKQEIGYAETHRLLLTVRMGQNDIPGAEQVALDAMKLFPTSHNFPLSMADLQRRQGKIEGVVKYLQVALENRPDDVGILRSYLVALLDAKEFTTFKAQVQQYYARKVDMPGLRALAALAKARQNKKEEARVQFLEVLGEVSGTPDESQVLGWMANAFGVDSLLQKSPELLAVSNTWRTNLILGQLWFSKGNLAQAEAYFLRAQPLAKDANAKLSVWRTLSEVYEQLKKYDKLESIYKEILNQNPNDKRAMNNLAYFYIERKNQPEKGLPYARKAARLWSGDMDIVDTYAWALVKTGKYEEALKHLKKVVRRGEQRPTFLYHMGFVLEKTGDKSEARHYYRLANTMLKTNPEHILRETVSKALARVETTESK